MRRKRIGVIVERMVLGTALGVIAFVVERQLTKSIKGHKAKPSLRRLRSKGDAT